MRSYGLGALVCALRNGGLGSALACGPFPEHAETSLETVAYARGKGRSVQTAHCAPPLGFPRLRHSILPPLCRKRTSYTVRLEKDW